MIKDIFELVEKIRNEIRYSGYKSETRIRIDLSQRYSKKDIDKVLSNLECKDIKCIKYSNIFISGLIKRYLYYYIPYKEDCKDG